MIGIQGETTLDEVTKSPADAALSTTSTNSVQNKVVTGAINELNNDLNEKATYGTSAFSETNFTLPSADYNYVVTHTGTYCFTIYSMSSVPNDVNIRIGEINLGSAYLGYQYDRLNVQVPLRRGTQITFHGTVGDGVNISYLQGVGDF